MPYIVLVILALFPGASGDGFKVDIRFAPLTEAMCEAFKPMAVQMWLDQGAAHVEAECRPERPA